MAEHWRIAAGDYADLTAWLDESSAGSVAICAANNSFVAALLPTAALAGIDLAFIPHRSPREQVLDRLDALGRPPLVSDREDLGDYAPADPTREDAGRLSIPSSGTTASGWHHLPWNAVMEATTTSAPSCGMRPDTPWLCCLPLEHVGGAMLVMRAVITGCDLVLTESFDAASVSRLIDEEGIAGASLVPTMLRRLIVQRDGKAFPPTLEHLIVGGDGCDDELRERCIGLGVTPRLTYGLTETAAMVCLQTPEEAAAGPGCGRPLPNREVRIVDGGIEVRSPATGEDWFAPGDLGHLADDGQLVVTGRGATRIVSGGVTLSAELIEQGLREHPNIEDAAACGVPDDEWGEAVAALLVGEEQDIAAWCDERFDPAWAPKQVKWVDALPLLANGKVDRSAVRRMWD